MGIAACSTRGRPTLNPPRSAIGWKQTGVEGFPTMYCGTARQRRLLLAIVSDASARHYMGNDQMQAHRDIEILNLINALAHQATAAMQRSLRDAELGLVAMEARTLRFIARHPGCTQNDIVRESGRDKAQVARIIKVLLERGEVRKTAVAGSKRQQLDVTPAGAKSHGKAEVLRTAVAETLVAGLGAKERKELERMLRRMAENRQE